MLNNSRINILIIAIICLILIINTASVYAKSDEEIIKENRNAIVIIVNNTGKPKYLGLGFIINSEGLVLTNSHVIGSENFHIKDLKNNLYEVDKLIFRDSKRDLVLMQLADVSNMPAVELGDSKTLNLGDRITTIGNYNFKKGNFVSAKTNVGKMVNLPSQEQNRIMVESALALPMIVEGSPIFDRKGKVVGILTRSSDFDDALAPYAIAINDLHRYRNQIRSYLKDSSQSVKVSKVKFKVREEDKEVEIEKREKIKEETTIKAIDKNDNKLKQSQKDQDKQINKNTNNKSPLLSRIFDKNVLKKEDRTKVNKNNNKQSNHIDKNAKSESIIKPEKQKSEPDKIAINDIKLAERSGKIPKTRSNFGIDLSGYWFDVATGLNLQVEQKDSTILITTVVSDVASKRIYNLQGVFKKDGSIYVGKIENTLNCNNSCKMSEPAEIYTWDDSKISLRVNTVYDYNCKTCSHPSSIDWQDRVWLRKAVTKN
ncbi:MAG: trypsin-like peptidase domain-containing protein [Cyanobacteriota bacterium]